MPGPDRVGRGLPGRRASTSYRRAELLVRPDRRSPPVDPDRPRDVRAVAAHRAADVDDDRLAGARSRARRPRGGARRCSGPEATIAERAGRRGPRRRAGRGPRGRRPPRSARRAGPPAIASTTRSAACAGPPQQRDLVGVLDHPERRGAPGRRARTARRAAPAAARARTPPAARPRRRRRRPRRPAARSPRRAAPRRAHRVLGLLPGRDLDRPGRAAGHASAGVASSRGATSVAGAPSRAGSTSRVSRSSGWAS